MASTRIHIDEARLGRVQKQDRFATGVLTAIVAIVMLIVVSMVAYILFEGISTLFQPGFLTEPSRANGTQGGVLYQLFDSFYLLLITLIISVPISLGGAVFLVEYAPDGPVRDIASTAIETLSSLPSIVVGMFGFLVFSVQLGWKYSIISGAVALTMFNIPILVRVIQQALEDVPQAQRDACLAMGLTRWEATLHILIPEAMPAIVTGIVLSAGRVFGEAADRAVRRVLNQEDRPAQTDGHRDDQSDQQQVERVEQLVEHATLGTVGARRLREKARLEQRRDALEQDIGHHGDDDEHDDGGDRRQHARGDAVLLLDAPEPRLVDMDARASHEPSPPCGR